MVNQKPAGAIIHTNMSEEKRKKRQTKRAIRKIARKAMNSASSQKRDEDQNILDYQHKVKGTKSLLNSLERYGKKKK